MHEEAQLNCSMLWSQVHRLLPTENHASLKALYILNIIHIQLKQCLFQTFSSKQICQCSISSANNQNNLSVNMLNNIDSEIASNHNAVVVVDGPHNIICIHDNI